MLGRGVTGDLTEGEPKLNWRRLGFLDLLVMYVCMEIVLYYWDLLSTDFIVF